MQIKGALINIGILLVAVAVSLPLAEFVSRLVLNPADFVGLEVVHDDILGGVPSPSAMASFDRWGFRNPKVPDSADIVAVGDSHTYGNTARMIDSWPYVLARLSGQKVYNMGLGGYGPNQYFYLSKTKALSLKPKMIIWGLYMGDDFENAFSITYGLDYWKYLRILPPQKVETNIWERTPTDTAVRKMRVWLSHHSVIYQLLFHMGFGGHINGEIQIRNAAALYPGYATSINLPDRHILEAFRPKATLFGLDQDNPNVREGMRITFELLKEMKEICQRDGVQFVVVVIPSKEMVFSDYLENNSQLPLSDAISKLLPSERSALAQTFKFMSDNNIEFVDTLPGLKKSAGQGLYALSAVDMHPGRNGYRVIGEAVAEYLKQASTRSRH